MTKEEYDYLKEKAIRYMKTIADPEHNYQHLKDVVNYAKELLEYYPNVNKDVVLLSAYWHDVARIYGNENHEEKSAKMLRSELENLNVDSKFINECEEAIKYHKWNMIPNTLEGKIVRDADKLAFIGINRWIECQKKNKDLNDIKKLLPDLRNKILLLDESRKIYDRDILKIEEFLKEN